MQHSIALFIILIIINNNYKLCKLLRSCIILPNQICHFYLLGGNRNTRKESVNKNEKKADLKLRSHAHVLTQSSDFVKEDTVAPSISNNQN